MVHRYKFSKASALVRLVHVRYTCILLLTFSKASALVCIFKVTMEFFFFNFYVFGHGIGNTERRMVHCR
jgi:hypothetical protein